MRTYLEILIDLKATITPQENSYLEELLLKFQEDLEDVKNELRIVEKSLKTTWHFLPVGFATTK